MNIPGVSPMKMLTMKRAVEGTLKLGSVVRLYTGATNSGWQFEAMGLLFLLEYSQGKKKAYYLALVDFNTDKTVWQQELYKSVRLDLLDRYFISFEGDDTMFGLSFADSCDAVEFHTQAKKLVDSVAGKKSKKGGKKGKKGGGGWFGRFFGKKEEQERAVISGPKNFSHGMHIGVVPGQGFVHDNLPDEWQTIFADAGISKEQYEDPKTARKMMKAIKKFKNEKSGKKPKGKKKLPKKQKKQKGGGGGAAPPPPPPPPGGDIFSGSGGGGGGPPSSGGGGGGGSAPKGAPPPAGGRGDLLADIRNFKNAGGALKKASERKVELDVKELSGNDRMDLMSVLKSSIMQRKGAMEGSEDEDEDDSEGWSEDEEENWA